MDPAARAGRWRTLTAAPHRAFFFGGAIALAVAAAWWALRLVDRAGVGSGVASAVPDPWAHAWLMTFGVLPGFVFGFLFTTFPRWMNTAPVARWAYATVFGTYGAALALAAVGLVAGLPAFAVGAWLLAAAWALAWIALLEVLLRTDAPVSHAVTAAISLGLGLVAAVACAYGFTVASGTIVHTALRAAIAACWLPLVYAVCHRMLPFFSQSAILGYRMHRPLAWLVTFAAAAWVHQLLALYGAFEWLWPPSLVLAVVASLALFRWQPLASRKVPLLWSLYAAYAWLPLGLWLQFAQNAAYAATGEWHLGRAPLHALAVGFFLSLVVAMATRVTLGHSGRPLAMDRYTVRCFLLVQAGAALRVASELVPAGTALAQALLVASILAFAAGALGWTARYAPVYLAPRVDGRPG